jgi:hypothetical protein
VQGSAFADRTGNEERISERYAGAGMTLGVSRVDVGFLEQQQFTRFNVPFNGGEVQEGNISKRICIHERRRVIFLKEHAFMSAGG